MTRRARTDLPIRVVDGGGGLYEKQPKVYPREVGGRFQRLRIGVVFWLLGMFYAFPWISIGGQQLVLFDLPARRFHVFGLTFWPQDFYLLTLLLIIAALSLFFFTALAGRLWCGYACPQTVWTEVFLWMERRIEGDRNARMRLDKSPWNRQKILRKSAKQGVWIAFALWTGFTFVGFFTPIRELGHETIAGGLGNWELFWIAFYAFATYGNAGLLREQVCKYMCPYARFQSAMFDRDTLVISYDVRRGEPRGHRSVARLHAVPVAVASTKPLALGDCIDCLACVQVCPTGIDIRDGLQIDCIACAACIDACDAVMDKVGYPRGLIRYTTEHEAEGNPSRIVRPRIVVYAVVLAAIIVAFGWGVVARKPVIIEILHDRNGLFRTADRGVIENSYNVKLVNKTDHAISLVLEAQTTLPLKIIGQTAVTLDPGEIASLPLTLRADAGTVHGRNPIVIAATSIDHTATARGNAHFFAPEAR